MEVSPTLGTRKKYLQFEIFLVFLEAQEINIRGTWKVNMIIVLYELFFFCLKVPHSPS